MRQIATIRLLTILAGLACVLGGAARAQSPFAPGWSLQPAQSKLNFQTIKNQTTVELSSFASLRGTIAPDGQAQVTIALDSVDTGIDLRNVRMRFLFFETFKFPEAVVAMRLDPKALGDLPEQRRMTLKGVKYELTLHGVTKPMTGDIAVTLLSDQLVSVASAAPISVAAADFNLSDGVKKLEDANQVPTVPSGTVTFDFTFRKDAGAASKPAEAAVAPQRTAVEKEGELDAEACTGRFEIISRTGAIYFRTGSADLDPQSKPLLDSVDQIVRRCPKLAIQVAGHTDSVGDPAANRALSAARAKAVVTYLVGRGIPANRLQATGLGDTSPVASNDTADGRARNRRIVFSVSSGG